MTKQLHKGDETRRRWNIIAAGHARDASYVPQLLARLDSKETHDNKRHIVRALGNIGDMRAETRLLGLLETSEGAMLGDVLHAVGQLRSHKAVGQIKRLLDHETEWVRQNAKWALRQIAGDA